MIGKIARMLVLGVGTALATQGLAQNPVIVLESTDGSIRLSGELQGFDGQTYQLLTAIGPVSINAADVKCTSENCPALEDLSTEFLISGSQDLATSLFPALVDGFSFRMDADVMMAAGADAIQGMSLTGPDGEELAKIGLVTQGSSEGLRDLIDGTAALAMTTRQVRDTELDAARAAGLGDLARPPLETVLALDGLLIVTSRDNPVRALTEQNIARIFAGQIRNWAEVGGPNAPINLYARPEDTGTGAVFFNLVMRPERLRVSTEARLLDSDAAVSDAVAADANGIGFSSFSNERNAKSLALRGVCGIQTPANAFTIKTEEYPLTRRLYLYRGDNPLPKPAEEFLAYVQSADAQDVISQTGFVDQGVSSLSVNEMGLRFMSAVLPSDAESSLPQLQEMMLDLIAADRMSLTFRFETGSARLDSRAEADVQRLAEIINEGRLVNKEVLLIGYTDSVGRADINLNLSSQRAEQARQALLALVDPAKLQEYGTELRSLGYGEMSPLGCNENPNGRRINRRVEVWTRDIIR